MKINENKLFPYPVLSKMNGDYISSKFEVKMISCKESNKEISIQSNIKLENENLNELIESKKAKIIYHLECPKTKYRTIKPMGVGENKIIIENKFLEGHLDIVPLIISETNIEDYFSDDFNKEYEKNIFKIDKGSILAIGEQFKVPITKEIGNLSEIPSIISIVRGRNEERMTIDSSGDKIKVILPENNYELYAKLKGGPRFNKVLISMIIVPALMHVLMDVKDQLSSPTNLLTDNRWFRVLDKKTKKMGINFKEEINNPSAILKLAQEIFENPLTSSMESLDKLGNNEE